MSSLSVDFSTPSNAALTIFSIPAESFSACVSLSRPDTLATERECLKSVHAANAAITSGHTASRSDRRWVIVKMQCLIQHSQEPLRITGSAQDTSRASSLIIFQSQLCSHGQRRCTVLAVNCKSYVLVTIWIIHCFPPKNGEASPPPEYRFTRRGTLCSSRRPACKRQ